MFRQRSTLEYLDDIPIKVFAREERQPSLALDICKGIATLLNKALPSLIQRVRFDAYNRWYKRVTKLSAKIIGFDKGQGTTEIDRIL